MVFIMEEESTVLKVERLEAGGAGAYRMDSQRGKGRGIISRG